MREEKCKACMMIICKEGKQVKAPTGFDTKTQLEQVRQMSVMPGSQLRCMWGEARRHLYSHAIRESSREFEREDGQFANKFKSCTMITCKECKKAKAPTEFDTQPSRHRYTRCRACEHPNCDACGERLKDIWTPHPLAKEKRFICPACKKKSQRKIA